MSLVCGSWIEALYSFRRDPTLPPGERDDTAELVEAVERYLKAEQSYEDGSPVGVLDLGPAIRLGEARDNLHAALAKRKART